MKTKQNTIHKTLIAASIALLVTGSASAGNRYHQDQDNGYSNIDFAKVVSVNDVIERVEYSEPVQDCYDKRVRVERDRRYSSSQVNSRTPDILGAIIGAAVGNQVGKRGSSSGRRVATVAGAVLGGSIGRDTRKRGNRGHRHDDYAYDDYKTVRHCDTNYETHYKNKVVGYDVKYRYRGKVYSARMNEHPGERVKVRVNVTPVYS